MSEAAIRTDIKSHLRGRFAKVPGARWVEEMEVCAGRGRIDLALITHRFIGIEIKGPKDSLARLGGQVVQYSRCFDMVILVAHERWASSALKMIPSWWGLIQGEDSAGAYVYRLVRRPTLNTQVDLSALLGLLWRDEITRIFAECLNREAPARAPKHALRGQLLEEVAAPRLKAVSLEALRHRAGWRAASPALCRVAAAGQ
jgi:hypothetical protein